MTSPGHDPEQNPT